MKKLPRGSITWKHPLLNMNALASSGTTTSDATVLVVDCTYMEPLNALERALLMLSMGGKIDDSLDN